MTAGDYLDFDLLIEPHNDEYRARVINSPSGEATTTFTLPVSLDRIENKALKLLPTRGTRRASPQVRKQARDFGSMLFDSVFVDDVRVCFKTSQREAESAGKGLRIRLRLGDPSLEIVPWEFMYSTLKDDFLVLSRHTPVVRYIEMVNTVPPAPVALPLKIVVMIANPTDHAQLDVEGEWQRLQHAMADRVQRGEIELTRVPRGSLSSLRETLEQDMFHIFHYVGHAAFDPTNEDGVLLLEGADGKGQQVAGRDLSTILADQTSLRLALLNACEGAVTSDEDRFTGIAQSLIRRRLPAVIAMQFEITDDAALVLSRDFYGALAAGFPVDMALAEARRGIFADQNVVEWATPVLYVRSGAGDVFDIDDAAPLQVEPEQNKEIPLVSHDAVKPVAQQIATTAPPPPPPTTKPPAAPSSAPPKARPTATATATPVTKVSQDRSLPWWKRPIGVITLCLVGMFVLLAIIGAAMEAGESTPTSVGPTDMRTHLTNQGVGLPNVSDADLLANAELVCATAGASPTLADFNLAVGELAFHEQAMVAASFDIHCPAQFQRLLGQ